MAQPKKDDDRTLGIRGLSGSSVFPPMALALLLWSRHVGGIGKKTLKDEFYLLIHRAMFAFCKFGKLFL